VTVAQVIVLVVGLVAYLLLAFVCIAFIHACEQAQRDRDSRWSDEREEADL
jgi:hypothetical protein